MGHSSLFLPLRVECIMRDREKWLSLDGSDFYRKRLVEEQKEKRIIPLMVLQQWK